MVEEFPHQKKKSSNMPQEMAANDPTISSKRVKWAFNFLPTMHIYRASVKIKNVAFRRENPTA